MNTKALRQKILDLAIRGKLVPPVCRQAGKTLTTNPLPPINGVDCWFTYVIECEDGTFYKGFTHDLLNRYKEHCKGVGADYTRVHKPKQLYYWEMHYSQEKAILREKYLKSGVGREWFKREVVEKPENWEPASVLLDRIRAEKARLSADRERLVKEGKIKRPKKNATSDTPHYENVPFEVPEGWVWCKIDDIGEVVTGSTPSKDIKEYYGNDFPFFKPTDLEQGEFTKEASDGLTNAGIKVARKLPSKSVLVTCIGATIGKTGLTQCEGATNQQINAIIPFSIILPEYLYFTCISDYMQKEIKENASATTLPILNKNNFAALFIPLPPLTEQTLIVDEVKKWMSIVDDIESSKTDLQQLIAQAKSKILDLAIRGKLVPQDPNDEPASELLKRINPEWESSESEDSDSVPQGWCACNFDDVFSTVSDKPYQIKQKEILPEGSYPVVTQSYVNLIEGYSDNSEKLYSIETPLILFGDHTRAVKYIDFDFIVGADGTKLILPKIAPKYSYYLISHLSTKIENKGYSRHFGQIRCYPIILPPLPEQHRIVAKIEELFAALDSIGQALVDDNLIRCRFVLQLRSRAVSS